MSFSSKSLSGPSSSPVCTGGSSGRYFTSPILQLIRLYRGTAEPKFALAQRRDPKQPILPLIPVHNAGHRPDLIRRCGRTNLTSTADQNDSETSAVAHAVADHVDITCFEYPQR